jgi:hypothetical protein
MKKVCETSSGESFCIIKFPEKEKWERVESLVKEIIAQISPTVGR